MGGPPGSEHTTNICIYIEKVSAVDVLRWLTSLAILLLVQMSGEIK